MKSVANYTALITSWHATRPKFRATIETIAGPFVDLDEKNYSLIHDFDIDYAIGAQLDVVGQWVGRSRSVWQPAPNPWFSLDYPLKGFDKGIWKGPYDLEEIRTDLPDEVYRRVLKSKILLNSWDGTTSSLESIIRIFFDDPETYVFVEDRQDMTISVCFTGKWPLGLFLLLAENDYLPTRSAGVKTYYLVTSIEEAPLFGFDANSDHIAGFDVGAYGVSPTKFVYDIIG